MDFLCPSCQKTLSVPDQYAGTKMKCPLCNSQFTAPSLPSPASAPIGGGPFPAPPPPPPPPPSILIPPSLASERPPAPPPSPGEYRGGFGFGLNARIIQWIAPAALVLVLILQFFFPWVGMYPGGYQAASQSAWGSIPGWYTADPLWQKMPEANPAVPAITLQEKKEEGKPAGPVSLNMSLLMLPYVLLSLVALAVCVLAAVLPLVTLKLPPIVDQLKPWRWPIAAGVALLPLLVLTLQLFLGFGLEERVRVEVESKLEGQKKAAKELADKLGVTDSEKLKIAEDNKLIEMARGSLLGAQELKRTMWLQAAWMLNLIAAAAAGVMFWLDRRTALGKPAPRLDVRW